MHMQSVEDVDVSILVVLRAALFDARVSNDSAPAKKDRLVESFLDALEFERNASPRTIRAYRDALAAFAAHPDFPGWKKSTSSAKKLSQLPKAARDYVKRLGELTGAKVSMISVGPKRAQTIFL